MWEVRENMEGFNGMGFWKLFLNYIIYRSIKFS